MAKKATKKAAKKAAKKKPAKKAKKQRRSNLCNASRKGLAQRDLFAFIHFASHWRK